MPSQKPVALVVGASRGIGRQVAVDLAKNGYAVVVAAKSISDPSKPIPFPPNPKSQDSTITTVTQEIIHAGGDATAIQVDVRDEKSVQKLIDDTIAKYGRLDVIVYNSGAIWWSSVATTPSSATSSCSASTQRASTPRFFRGKTAYAMGKIGMSVLTKGLAMDFEREGLKDMSITSIWPAVAIESAATEKFSKQNPDDEKDLRKPTIFSDAILAILAAPPAKVNGELLLDEDFLREYAGVTDFAKYDVVPGSNPRRIMPARLPDLTVAEQDDEGKRFDSAKSKL
ncbi:Hydroxysteroid dehydrogenase-like 2-like protein [Cladobotryum mycophilum]|uniref:Hydroxysteroid dehydrogenase-like 2-like protein n=1 Tax=Cladobotryum mycophilum TaxID=491253 RepID=A0ABR0SDY2_9HYPO